MVIRPSQLHFQMCCGGPSDRGPYLTSRVEQARRTKHVYKRPAYVPRVIIVDTLLRAATTNRRQVVYRHCIEDTWFRPEVHKKGQTKKVMSLER